MRKNSVEYKNGFKNYTSYLTIKLLIDHLGA